MGVALILLFVVLAATGAAVSYYLKQKRQQELALIARQLGLEYSPVDNQGCLALPFALLSKGDGQGADNVLYGMWQDMPLREFDYWYYEESTDSQGRTSKTYYRFSCAVTELEAYCSHLALDRENVFTVLADHMGLHDIEFESEEFNRAFNVKSGDRKFANDLIDARMMQWLVTVDDAFQFEVSGKWILCFSKRRAPLDLVPLIGTLQQFRQRVPRVVYELYGPTASG
jgi:hypothetical protein